jgi:hypothetical protein
MSQKLTRRAIAFALAPCCTHKMLRAYSRHFTDTLAHRLCLEAYQDAPGSISSLRSSLS